MESESAPPDMKMETTTGASGAAAAAAAMPSSQAAGASAPPPKTASASPLERARNERRDRPVPAGSGMPGSIDAQAAAGLGRGLAQDRGARVVLAVAGLHRNGPQQVW